MRVSGTRARLIIQDCASVVSIDDVAQARLVSLATGEVGL